MKKYSWHKGDNKWQKFWRWLAFRLPRPLVYWASIRLISYATVGQYSTTEVPALTAMEALGRWEKGNQIPATLQEAS